MRIVTVLLSAVSFVVQTPVVPLRAQALSSARAPVLARDARPPGAPLADSASTGVELYAEVRLVSRYIWRGYDLSLGKPAVQPYAEVTLPSGLGFNAFFTSALDSRSEFDEAQLGVTYSRAVGAAWEVMAGYLRYLMPGTETEPNSDPADPGAFSSTGEFVLALSRHWDAGYVTVTYSRGHGEGRGNSVNLWVQRTLALRGERWSAEPYLQADYLDEYPPDGGFSGFGERISGVEVGVPVFVRLGGARALVGVHLTWVPSDYVRSANTGARSVQPWFTVGVVYERD